MPTTDNLDDLTLAERERIDEFAKNLALALQRITGRVSTPNEKAQIPQPAGKDVQNNHQHSEQGEYDEK